MHRCRISIDGVFNFCHCGHYNHVFCALKYGNRLMVGVMIEDSLKEWFRFVYEVIPGNPCYGLTREFLGD